MDMYVNYMSSPTNFRIVTGGRGGKYIVRAIFEFEKKVKMFVIGDVAPCNL